MGNLIERYPYIAVGLVLGVGLFLLQRTSKPAPTSNPAWTGAVTTTADMRSPALVSAEMQASALDALYQRITTEEQARWAAYQQSNSSYPGGY